LCDREISKATIGGSLTSSAGQNGSQALGMVQQRVRLDIRDADAKSLAATLRRDLAQAFVAFNFSTDKLKLAPRITPQLEEPEDLVQKADVLTKLQALGLEIPEGWVRETFGVPALNGKELTLKRTAPTQSALEAFTRQASLEDSSPKGVIEGQAYTLG
jgi:phage gp29-like protein